MIFKQFPPFQFCLKMKIKFTSELEISERFSTAISGKGNQHKDQAPILGPNISNIPANTGQFCVGNGSPIRDTLVVKDCFFFQVFCVGK